MSKNGRPGCSSRVLRNNSIPEALGIRTSVMTMSGGVAKNKGVVAFMEEKLGRPIHVYREPQIIGALGAAVIAQTELIKQE